jgi:hypothetical protein
VLCVVRYRLSAASWSLVQRSPTDCGSSLCVISKSRERGGHSLRWAAEPDKINKNSSIRLIRCYSNWCVLWSYIPGSWFCIWLYPPDFMDGFVEEYGAAYDQILWRNMVLPTTKFCEGIWCCLLSNFCDAVGIECLILSLVLFSCILPLFGLGILPYSAHLWLKMSKNYFNVVWWTACNVFYNRIGTERTLNVLWTVNLITFISIPINNLYMFRADLLLIIIYSVHVSFAVCTEDYLLIICSKPAQNM